MALGWVLVILDLLAVLRRGTNPRRGDLLGVQLDHRLLRNSFSLKQGHCTAPNTPSYSTNLSSWTNDGNHRAY